MHGSQSFVSAVGLAISFRSLNLVSFAILVIWALSPLGGQSSLRLLSESNATSTEVSTIYYPNAAGRSYLHQAYPISYINQMSAILSTSMLTADTLWNSSVDIWNHPKIPRLSELERENINNENLGEWKDLAVESYVIYPSLTGIGLFGLEPKTTANLTIPYEYILADCALHMRDPGNKTNEFFKNYKFSNASSPFGASKPYLLPYGWPFNASMADIINPNMTLFGTKYWGPNNAAYYQSSFFLTGLSVYPDAERFVYLGLHDTVPDKGIGVALYKCSLRTVALEANILCRFPECRVHRLRRAAKTVPDEPSPDAEKSPWGVINWNFYFEDFLEYFGTMCGMTTRFSYHPIDNYIYGRTNSSLSYFRNDMIPAHDWSTVPDTQISERLTHILNTYYEASRWLDTTPRNDPHGTFVINSTTGAPYENLKLSNTSATVTREFPIYKASIPWVVTLIVCSTVLLALGIISIVVTLRLSVPDIFGFVSSLTRDNPYIHLPDGGSSLDGEERARLLKDLKVQLGDVREEDKVGYIALRGGVSGQTARTGRVGRGRLYW